MHDVMNATFNEVLTRSVSGLSSGQLRTWHKNGFFRSTLATRDARLHLNYAFIDLVALRVLYVVRFQYAVSLHALSRFAEILRSSRLDRWTGVRIYVLKRHVYLVGPNIEPMRLIETRPRLAVTLDMDDVIRDVAGEAQALLADGEAQVTVRGTRRPAPLYWDQPSAS